jgi:hypothetical protein
MDTLIGSLKVVGVIAAIGVAGYFAVTRAST